MKFSSSMLQLDSRSSISHGSSSPIQLSNPSLIVPRGQTCSPSVSLGSSPGSQVVQTPPPPPFGGGSHGSSVSSGGGKGPPPPSPQSVQSSISATTSASAVPQLKFSPVTGSVSQQVFILRLYQHFPGEHENPSLLGRSQKRSDDD